MCPFVFHRANWVKVYGTKYQTPCALVVGKTDDDPLFESVHKILVSGQEVFFEFEKMDAVFCPHYHAYALSLTPTFPCQAEGSNYLPPLWLVSLSTYFYCIIFAILRSKK